MSRGKKFASTHYKPVAQTADSEDDDIILFDLSSSPSPPLTHPPTHTTEFGVGQYDCSRDLELPEVGRLPRRRRKGGRVKFRLAREAKTCVCVLMVVVVAVGLLVVAFSQFRVRLSQVLQASSSSTAPSSSAMVTPVASPLVHPLAPPTAPPTSAPTAPPAAPPTAPPTSAPTAPALPLPVEVPSSSAVKEGFEGSPATSGTPAVGTLSLPSPSPTTAAPPPSPEPPTGSSPPPSTDLPPPSSDLPLTSPPPPADGEGNSTAISWEREFFPALTETTLQLQDMNRDGVTDVVMVDGYSPCGMRILALDGQTGETVWESEAQFDSFALRCEVDLNKDGIIDCLSAGRQSGFKALSGVDGSVLWERDPRLAYHRYNFYFPLIIPDLDGDDVSDLINTHGGDSTYSSEDTERSPSFLVVVSGRTGRQLMERVPMPDGRESYMSPVLYSWGEEGEVVLVGTGGETLFGSLWAISMDSLRERVASYLRSHGDGEDYEPFMNYTNHPCIGDMTKEQLEELRPVFDHSAFRLNESFDSQDHPLAACPTWGDFKPLWNEYGLCVYHLVQTQQKGVVLPPVVVDMTGDGQEDLVVSCFEGRTLVMDGRDGSTVWEVDVPGTESYSIPAPLFYNSDDTPDLLVRVNRGEWNEYNYSYVAVLDGRNGDTLWRFYSTLTGMMSGLSLASDHPGGDGLVFISVGHMDENDPVIKEKSVRRRRTASPDDSFRACLESDEECWREAGVRGRREDRGDEVMMLGVGGGEVEMLGDDVMEAVGGEAEEEDDGSAQEYVHYDDFMQQAMNYRDPANLWDGDDYPHPQTNLSGFLSYCGMSASDYTGSLYVLTREQVEKDYVLPLASRGLEIYIPPSPVKRHGHSDHNQHYSDISEMDPAQIKKERCGHLMALDMVPSTPAIGDLNGDGRLEVAYVLIWGGADSNMGGNLPPKVRVYVFTLEERVREVYGEGGVEWVRRFLPSEKQPWTRYMGATGDNVFQSFN